MQLSAKFLPFFVLLLAVWHMWRGVLDARQHKATGVALFAEHHQDEMKRAMLWLAVTVLMIVLVRQNIKPSGYQSIFWVHLPLVLTAAGIFVAIFARFDGFRMPRIHPRLGYAGIGSVGLGATIGMYMLVQM